MVQFGGNMHTRRGVISVMAISIVVSRELLFHNSLYGLVNFFCEAGIQSRDLYPLLSWANKLWATTGCPLFFQMKSKMGEALKPQTSKGWEGVWCCCAVSQNVDCLSVHGSGSNVVRNCSGGKPYVVKKSACGLAWAWQVSLCQKSLSSVLLCGCANEQLFGQALCLPWCWNEDCSGVSGLHQNL